jgi:AcrR family transcriptional regulator
MMVLTVRSVRISSGSTVGQDAPVTSAPETSERVASILAAACRVVVREGAHGLRMASVAQEAGVSKALVHYYFSTRQELMRSAFAWSEEQWHAALGEEVGVLTTGAERLERVLLMSIETAGPFSNQRALWNEVWSSLRFDDALRPLVEASYRAWLDRLRGLIEAGRRDTSIPRALDATEAAWRLAAVGDGLDSMLYLGLLGRDKARELMLGSIRRELAGE